MYRLFRLIIARNWRSIFILFFTLFLTGAGFITMRLLTDNVSESVSRETRPLFGADLKISYEWLPEKPLALTFSEYLSGSKNTMAEVREFSTTLFDREGKPWLVNVIAYSGSYPQKWILETEILTPREIQYRVSASEDLLSKYVSGWILRIDDRNIRITDRIIRSSDLWFSFGGENALIILPIDLLSGSLLISSGSRLDSELFVSFPRDTEALTIQKKIDKKRYPEYRIRTYKDRSEQSLETVENLTEYILLILVIISVFALIITRSAHDRLFTTLSKTLAITEILWLTRKRQIFLFLIVYALIFPLSLLLAIGFSAGVIEIVSRFPGAEGFVFLFRSVLWSIGLMSILTISALYPAWRERFGWKLTLPLFFKKNPLTRAFPRLGKMWEGDLSVWCVSFLTSVVTLFYIFSDGMKVLFLVWIGWVILSVFIFAIHSSYHILFSFAKRYRYQNFPLYDAIRTHIRPLTPTRAITLSLIMVTTALIVFVMFSLAFRSKLILDTTSVANIYAINILEQDREKIERYMAWSGELYSVIRARIMEINGESLALHLGVENPSREFTREFNMTTTPLDTQIIRGKSHLDTDEVSLDEDFSKQIGLDIGDRVTFLISWRDISFTVANIRKSERQGFRPFFYFSFDPSALPLAPKTYFAATYTTDTTAWKKWILANSWPHVTFIDIENILTIARDIGGKILSVISLFFLWIILFAIFAIIALFAEMRYVEDMKRRLYILFGMISKDIESSIIQSRWIIYSVSWLLALISGGGITYFLFSRNAFFEFSLLHFTILMFGIATSYALLWRVLKK